MDFAGLGFRDSSTLVQGIATSTISVGKTISVSVSGTVVTCRASRDLTAAVGDVILLGRLNDQLIALARLFAAAPAAAPPEEVDPPPPAQPTIITGSTVIAPVETRSYRSSGYVGWRTDNDEVYQGEYGSNGLHIGCIFYGSKPRSLDGVTVTSATFRAKRLSGGDYAKRQTTLRRISQKTRPSGAPTLISGESDGPNLAVNTSASSISVPTSWAQALVDGTAGGLALYESDGIPYTKYAGRASYSTAFTLTVNWKRET